MTNGSEEDKPKSGELLPPEPGDDTGGLSQTLIALVSNYTDRPDLLIAEIEKHDPGFVRRMNAASEEGAAQLRDARFTFGKIQAYASLALSFTVGLLIVGAIIGAVWYDRGFWTIIALICAYAVAQGGTTGFQKIADGIAYLVRTIRGDGGHPPKS